LIDAPLDSQHKAHRSASHYTSVSAYVLSSRILHDYCILSLDKFINNASCINLGIVISFWTLASQMHICICTVTFYEKSMYMRFHLACINIFLWIKKPFSKIPKGAFHTLMFYPQKKWWFHLNNRKDRVIYQASIKEFVWSQHYRAVFLCDDGEGERNLLKTNLSRGIIFIFMMTLQ